MSYGVEWIPGGVAVQAVLLLLVVPHFALLAVVIVVLASLWAVLALAAVALASPYLLARALVRRRTERPMVPRGDVLARRPPVLRAAPVQPGRRGGAA